MQAPWLHSDQPLSLPADPAHGCPEAGQAYQAAPATPGCAECLATGSDWVHLRLCMACGHVGCCDSSPGKHATAHFHTSGHPVIRSAEQGEGWGWCYRHALYWQG